MAIKTKEDVLKIVADSLSDRAVRQAAEEQEALRKANIEVDEILDQLVKNLKSNIVRGKFQAVYPRLSKQVTDLLTERGEALGFSVRLEGNWPRHSVCVGWKRLMIEAGFVPDTRPDNH